MKCEQETAEDCERREQKTAEECERCEQQIAEERQIYAEESDRRINAKAKQIEMLQDMVKGHSKTGTVLEKDSVKLTRLSENDDIEMYLTMFESHGGTRDRRVSVGIQTCPAADGQGTAGICGAWLRGCQELCNGVGGDTAPLQY